MNKLKIWIEEVRAPFFTAAIAPVLLGGAIAFARTGNIHWGFLLLTLLGGILFHAGTNVANDYFDHKSGNDEINTEFVRPFTGGSRIIQRGLLNPREVLTGSLLMLAAGAAIGLYLALERSLLILAIGAFGLFSAYFYTAPPVRLVARGVGELFVGLNFGILMTLGSYVAQTGSLSLEPVVAALSISFLIAAVLYVNEFQDCNADKAVGKNTLVVRFGKEKASKVFVLIMALAYISVIIPVLMGILPPIALIAVLASPLAVKASLTALKFYNDNQKLIPANGSTILSHVATGVLLIVAYVVHGMMAK